MRRGSRGPDLGQLHRRTELKNFFLEAQYSERNLINGKGRRRSDHRSRGRHLDRRPTELRLPGVASLLRRLRRQRAQQREHPRSRRLGSWRPITSGTHDIVVGFDTFDDINVIENHQSGSDFQVWTFEPSIVRGERRLPAVHLQRRQPPALGSGARGDARHEVRRPTRSSSTTPGVSATDGDSIIGVRYDENESSNGSGEIISDDEQDWHLGWAHRLTSRATATGSSTQPMRNTHRR